MINEIGFVVCQEQGSAWNTFRYSRQPVIVLKINDLGSAADALRLCAIPQGKENVTVGADEHAAPCVSDFTVRPNDISIRRFVIRGGHLQDLRLATKIVKFCLRLRRLEVLTVHVCWHR